MDPKLVYFLIFFATLLVTVLAVKFSSTVQGWVCPYKAPCNCPVAAVAAVAAAAASVKNAKAKKEMYQNY